MNALAKIPTFNKQIVWLELINEPAKEQADWLGQFGVECAQKALAQGYKIAMFAWSTGTPFVGAAGDPYNSWETPGMLAYLKLCAENPDRIAVSLHEYSLDNDHLMTGFPYLLGRFQFLLDTCDNHTIAHPTIIMSEWGWGADDLPSPDQGLSQLGQIAALYAKYPTILGAMLWYLGPGFGGIAGKADQYVLPMANYTLTHTFPEA